VQDRFRAVRAKHTAAFRQLARDGAGDAFLDSFESDLNSWIPADLKDWSVVDSWDTGAYESDPTRELGQILRLFGEPYLVNMSDPSNADLHAKLVVVKSKWLVVSAHYVLANYKQPYMCGFSDSTTNRQMNELKEQMAFVYLSDADGITDWFSASDNDEDGSKFWLTINKAWFLYPTGFWKCQRDGEDTVQKRTEDHLMAAFTLMAAKLVLLTHIPDTGREQEPYMFPLQRCGYLLGGIEVSLYQSYKDASDRLNKAKDLVGDICEIAFIATGGATKLGEVAAELAAEVAKKLINNGSKMGADAALDQVKAAMWNDAFGKSGSFKTFFFKIIHADTPTGIWMKTIFNTAYSEIRGMAQYQKL